MRNSKLLQKLHVLCLPMSPEALVCTPYKGVRIRGCNCVAGVTLSKPSPMRNAANGGQQGVS